MAGPVAQVLFAGSRAPGWRGIVAGLPLLVGPGLGTSRDANFFHVATTRLVGGCYAGEDGKRPFLLDVDTELPWQQASPEDAEVSPECYEQGFGLTPDHGILLCAMCNDCADHRILGEVALVLAEQLGGIIDMCGLIVPRAIDVGYVTAHLLDWPAVRAGVQGFTSAIPGIAAAIPYQVSEKRTWASHTVDATFLRAWLAHPEFHMIK